MEKPKVVARLALQGEENITSVSISEDGGLLAVSSVETVKLFQLIRAQPGAGPSLRIRKLDMPSIPGARTIKLTTDGKWLSTVSPTNNIHMVRIIRGEDPAETPRVLSRCHQLHRLNRDDESQTQPIGPLGKYERSIAHADFSTDGNVFAVADIAGYIDTWVLEGHEDSTAPEVDIEDSRMLEDNESDDDEEDESEQITYFGQRWVRNPSGHLFPRLDSIPVLMSFQPSTDTSDRPQPNGNPAVHPTRHNPHARSHELPSADYQLLMVSADHQIYLFDVMAGRLSEWSRRNPISSYPREYRQLDLPAKGCVWDVTELHRRIWLYGEKWLFMFDLSRDFPISDQEDAGSMKKRKRDKTAGAGAGDAIPLKESAVKKMRKFDSRDDIEGGKVPWMDITATGQLDIDDDDVEDGNQALANLRRTDTQDQATEIVQSGQRKQNESWWNTFKYRPILGILPVGNVEGQAPEVVLVERPSWDLDLPPRFVGTHEQ